MIRLLLLLLLFAVSAAFAGPSTINPAIPAANSALQSAPIRANFAAAQTDVNALIAQNSGVSAPASPVLGQLWLYTGATPYVLREWDGASWVQMTTINATTHASVAPVANGGTGLSGPGSVGNVLTSTGSSWASSAPAFSGTVTSVGLSLPGMFSVTGSPVTSSGTLGASLSSQSANTVLAGPSGSSGTPTFRALANADMPNFTGPITSSGGVNAVASQTGTGSTFVMSASPVISGTLSATGHTAFEGVTSTGATGTGKLVYDTLPNFTTGVGIGIAPLATLQTKHSTVTTQGVLADTSVFIGTAGNNNETATLGFGFANGATVNDTAAITYLVTNNAGQQAGDLLFMTRSVTTDTAPTTRLTVHASGAVDTAGTLAINGSTLNSSPAAGLQFNGSGGKFMVRTNGQEAYFVGTSVGYLGSNDASSTLNLVAGGNTVVTLGANHFYTVGSPVPSVANNDCGSSTQGTITAGGNDNSFKVTVGTAAVTSCAITFGTAWTTAPSSCTFTPANTTAAAAGTVAAYVSSITTTKVTIGGTALASSAFYVQCM